MNFWAVFHLQSVFQIGFKHIEEAIINLWFVMVTLELVWGFLQLGAAFFIMFLLSRFR